jgi:pilus assembly protein Flp/PilA
MVTDFQQLSFLTAHQGRTAEDATSTLNPKLKGAKDMIKNFLRDETGLELSEYAVAAALIALAVVGVFTTLGTNIKGVITNLATNIK